MRPDIREAILDEALSVLNSGSPFDKCALAAQRMNEVRTGRHKGGMERFAVEAAGAAVATIATIIASDEGHVEKGGRLGTQPALDLAINVVRPAQDLSIDDQIARMVVRVQEAHRRVELDQGSRHDLVPIFAQITAHAAFVATKTRPVNQTKPRQWAPSPHHVITPLCRIALPEYRFTSANLPAPSPAAAPR